MESIKRKVHIKTYVLAFMAVLFIFLSGIWAGKYVAYQRADDLEISQGAISAFLELSLMKEKYFNETGDYCSLSWDYIWKEKVGIGNVLSHLENRLGKDDERVLEQKKLYNDIQAKTHKLVEKINEKCGMGWDIILFFYTNDRSGSGGDFDLSEKQGYILDSVYDRHKDKAKIFSFDITLMDGESKEIKDKFQVEKAPTLVINGKKYGRFLSRYEIEKYF